MYKIATWNVERPKKGTEKTALVMEKIKEINSNPKSEESEDEDLNTDLVKDYSEAKSE